MRTNLIYTHSRPSQRQQIIETRTRGVAVYILIDAKACPELYISEECVQPQLRKLAVLLFQNEKVKDTNAGLINKLKLTLNLESLRNRRIIRYYTMQPIVRGGGLRQPKSLTISRGVRGNNFQLNPTLAVRVLYNTIAEHVQVQSIVSSLI